MVCKTFKLHFRSPSSDKPTTPANTNTLSQQRATTSQNLVQTTLLMASLPKYASPNFQHQLHQRHPLSPQATKTKPYSYTASHLEDQPELRNSYNIAEHVHKVKKEKEDLATKKSRENEKASPGYQAWIWD